MALEQIVPKSLIIPQKNKQKTMGDYIPIEKMKENLRKSFMSIYSTRIASLSSNRNPITYT